MDRFGNSYTEEQHFSLFYSIGLGALGIGIFLFAYYYSIDSFDKSDVIGFAILAVTFFPVVLLFLFWKQETRVDELGVHVRVRPWHSKAKSFKWSEIELAEVRHYRPITEFGGWGIRYSISSNSIAYSVSGSQAAFLDLKSGKRIVIGTRKAQDFAEAITQFQALSKER